MCRLMTLPPPGWGSVVSAVRAGRTCLFSTLPFKGRRRTPSFGEPQEAKPEASWCPTKRANLNLGQ